MMRKHVRAGAVRKGKKGPLVGSGGQKPKGLEGRGPTPRAEDRPHHPKARAAARRNASTDERRMDRRGKAPVHKSRGSEYIAGRNAVLEALNARMPAVRLLVAERVNADERVRDAIARASRRGIQISDVPRTDLDRMLGEGMVHQGIALQVPPYRYASVDDVLDVAAAAGQPPLIVALDGVTDPRNLGAIIRSVAAFGGHGVVIPERRSAGVTAAAWKTSAGAALRVKVAMVSNLAQTLTRLQESGCFVIGLDGGGEVLLPELGVADRPLVIVVGSEGKGLSRLVTKICDQIVSIPITEAAESLNAGIAGAVALYQTSLLRARAGATRSTSRTPTSD